MYLMHIYSHNVQREPVGKSQQSATFPKSPRATHVATTTAADQSTRVRLYTTKRAVHTHDVQTLILVKLSSALKCREHALLFSHLATLPPWYPDVSNLLAKSPAGPAP